MSSPPKAGAPPLLIRADASPRRGTGHVMRMLALAQAWREATGGSGHLVVAEPLPAALAARLEEEGVLVRALEGSPAPGGEDDVSQLLATGRALGVEAAVVDHYGFGSEALGQLDDSGLRVLAVDDYGHRKKLRASWVVNPNLHARQALYPAMPKEGLLLGAHYAPLRREFFRQPRGDIEVPERARRLLVTIGGSDPQQVTHRVLEGVALLGREDLEVSVVVGGGNADAEARAASLRAAAPHCKLVTNVTDIASWMVRHDVAVSAGGTTTQELLYLGLPSLVVAVAENQVEAVAALDAAGAAESLGWYSELEPKQVAERLEALLDSPARRRRMAERCRERQDGRGSERLVSTLRFGVALALRPVEAGDRRALWEWANDPQTRAASFTPDPIPWKDHVDWFEGRLADPRCFFFLGIVDDEAVGCVRFDQQERAADGLLVSVTVAPSWRGRGVGRALITTGTTRALGQAGLGTVRAYIRDGNAASIRAFEAAGYRPSGRVTIRGLPASHHEFRAPVARDLRA